MVILQTCQIQYKKKLKFDAAKDNLELWYQRSFSHFDTETKVVHDIN